MIAPNPNSICEQARVYYYDYLLGEPRKAITKEMIAHIDKCQYCQNEVKRLKLELVEKAAHAGKSTGETNSVITAGLRLHFAYIGALVTCETVRSFLPSLADPTLEVGIPTPITVHLDKCQQCADDLEVIRQLNLTHKQLCRLGQLFAEKPAEDAISCSQAQAAILAVVTMVFRETNAEVLKHLCTCPDCRELLYRYRETVREEFLHDLRDQKKFPCEAVSATDIFDYVISYGIDPANDQYAKFRESFTLHARTCLICLGKMQQLHNTLYSILERQESGIVTGFKLVDDSARDTIVSSPYDVYDDWPIEVKVFDKSKLAPIASTASAVFPRRLKQRVSALNLKQFIKPVVAAAIILIVALLVFYGPVAKAVDLGQIYKALDRIKNVYLTSFVPEKTEPTQEIWISRALNIKMFKTETQWVLWDVKNRFRKSRDLNTNLIKTAELNDDVFVQVEETMDVPWGLLPFDNISEVPKDAKWQKADDENIETLVPNTEVYDLTWIEKTSGGSIVYNKWRGYIDVETKLPKRIEWWEKLTKEKEYELRTVMKVTYPSAVKIQTIIRNAGF